MNTIKTVYNQELQNNIHLIRFIDEIKQKRFRCAGHAAQIVKDKYTQNISKNAQGERPIGRSWNRREDKKKCTLV